MQSYLNKLVTPLYDYVKFNDTAGDSHLLIYTRVLAITWACKLNIGDCVSSSVNFYSAWMNDPSNPTYSYFFKNVPTAFPFIYDDLLSNLLAISVSFRSIRRELSRARQLLTEVLQNGTLPSSFISIRTWRPNRPNFSTD